MELQTVSLKEWVKSNESLPITNQVISYPEVGVETLNAVEAEHFWFEVRRRIVLNLLKKNLGVQGVGLDVGCGSGFTTLWLSEHGYPTLGIDAYPIHRHPGNSLGFLKGDIYGIEPQPEFDFVVLLDVIEHIEDDVRFLQQVRKFLKPGGIIVVTTPAFSWLWSSVDKMSGHFRRYTKSSLAKKARAAGFGVEWQSYFYASTLPLYFATRLMSLFFRARKVSNVESMLSPVVNGILRFLVRQEEKALKYGGFPVGSSLFALLRRQEI